MGVLWITILCFPLYSSFMAKRKKSEPKIEVTFEYIEGPESEHALKSVFKMLLADEIEDPDKKAADESGQLRLF